MIVKAGEICHLFKEPNLVSLSSLIGLWSLFFNTFVYFFNTFVLKICFFFVNYGIIVVGAITYSQLKYLTVNRRHQTDNHRISRILFPIGKRRIISVLLCACKIGGSLKLKVSQWSIFILF